MQVPPLRWKEVLTTARKALEDGSGIAELQAAPDRFSRDENVSGTALATSGTLTLAGYGAFAGALTGLPTALPLMNLANGAFGVAFFAQSAVDATCALRERSPAHAWRAAVKASAGGLLLAAAIASSPLLATTGTAVGMSVLAWDYRQQIQHTSLQAWECFKRLSFPPTAG